MRDFQHYERHCLYWIILPINGLYYPIPKTEFISKMLLIRQVTCNNTSGMLYAEKVVNTLTKMTKYLVYREGI
jgi:hypothetical protein